MSDNIKDAGPAAAAGAIQDSAPAEAEGAVENASAVVLDKDAGALPSGSMSFAERVLGIILSPQETMADLAARPRLLFPILIMALTTPLLYLSRYPLFKAYMLENMENSMAQQGVAMSADQLAPMMEWLPLVSIGTAPFSTLIGWLIITGILFGLAKAMKGQGRFVQYLSVIGYAYVITVIYSLVCLVLSFFTGDLMMNTSLALFFSSLRGSFIYGMLRSVDLFNVWYYVLIAIGTQTVSSVSRTRMYGVVTVIYLIMMVFSGFTAQNL